MGVFSGLRFCVSTKSSQPNEAKTEEVKDGGDLTYNSLSTTIKELGGNLSSTVHKRINYVVATERAVERRTQRVRKAIKLGLPLVSPSFVTACAEAKKIVEYDSFSLLDEQTRSREAKTMADLKRKRKEHSSEGIEEEGSDTKSSKNKRSKNTSSASEALLQAVLDQADDELVRKVDLGCCCSCHDDGKPHCSWCEAHHNAAASESSSGD